MDLHDRRCAVLGVLGALCLGAIALAAPARADIIEFTFSGSIHTVNGPSPVSVGDGFTFSYVFDSETMDLDPAPNFGLYPAISRADVAAGAFMHMTNQGQITVLDNGFGGDSYQGLFMDPLVTSGANLGQIGGLVFMDDSLPDDLDLGVFDQRDFFVEVQVGPTMWDARGQIDRFRRRVIPGAGTLAACAVVGLGMGLRRRR